MIEFLKDHFVIFTTARNIKLDRASFTWNFDRINLKELNRSIEEYVSTSKLLLEEIKKTGKISKQTAKIAIAKLGAIRSENSIFSKYAIHENEENISKPSNEKFLKEPIDESINFTTSTDIEDKGYKESECISLQKQAQQSYQATNLLQLQYLQNKMLSTSCRSSQKNYVLRQLSYLMYNDFKRVEGQAMINGMRAILRQNDSFWPALTSLAEHYHEVKNFNQSANYYAKAVDVINDETKTLYADIPSPQTITRLIKNSELDLLAADYPPQASRGDNDGLMSFKYRSLRTRKKQLPIHFNSGKNILSGNDLNYARQLYRTLHKEDEPNIVLIGHTDPIGSMSMNLRLSKQRATTVKHFLKKKGYKGHIISRGKGETSPLYDPRGNAIKHYGKRRWYKMLSRIEVIIP